MNAINGTTFFLYKNDVAVGHTTGVALTLDVDQVESTNKDSNGFKEILPGVRSGKLSATGFTNYDDSVNFEEIADMVLTRSRAEFFLSQTTGAQGLVFRGEGFISSVEEVAEMESVTSYDIEINISGLFSIIDETEGEIWNAAQDIWNQIDINWNEI